MSVYFRFRTQARFRARLLRLPFQPRGTLARSRCAPRQALPVEKTCFFSPPNGWRSAGPSCCSALMEKRDFLKADRQPDFQSTPGPREPIQPGLSPDSAPRSFSKCPFLIGQGRP